MALTVKDILQLQSLCSFRLHAGQKGLSRYVVSAGIGDYEFCADIDFPRQTAFETDSLVLSSLLFAKGRPELLLPAVQQLYEAGVSGLAYKTVIFHELPDDVLAFCNAHAFPLFSFGSDAYFENIIYEIMNAVRADDTNLLTEGNIRRMLADDFAKSQVTLLAKSLSLAFKAHVMGVYIKVDDAAERDTFYQHAARCLKNFYLNRNLNDKALLISQNRRPLKSFSRSFWIFCITMKRRFASAAATFICRMRIWISVSAKAIRLISPPQLRRVALHPTTRSAPTVF